MTQPPVAVGNVPARPRRRAVELVTGVRTGPALLLSFGAIAALGAAGGGYAPPRWGWGALLFAWAAALALVLRSRPRLGPLEMAFLAALGGFVALTAVSVVWAADQAAVVQEMERSLLYLTAALAVVLLVRRNSVGRFLAGVLGGITVVCLYSLGTRLFPERLGQTDLLAGARLFEPLGYWNALGIFAALGLLLGLGFAARAKAASARALSAAVLPILALTVYFTFGRGPWVALAAGAVAVVLLDPRRLQWVSVVLALAAPSAAIVWLASTSDALTHQNASLSEATSQGHRLAWWTLAAFSASALAAYAFARGEARFHPARPLGIAYGSALVLLVAVGLGVVFARYGSPPTLAEKAWDSFKAPPPAIGDDLNRRLFSLSGTGRAEHWSVAWEQAREHPWLGAGPGSFEQAWHAERQITTTVRDAHNLYVEMLGELGVVGLALLVGALVVPMVAAIRVRSYRLVPAAFGAYVAYLVHAAIDWDWEMPAVTLAALFCGLALLVAARGERARLLSNRVRGGLLVVVVVLAAAALVGLVGNSALAASEEAAERGDWAEAASEARKARRWMPWSPAPWGALAEAQLGLDDLASARESFRRALAEDPQDWSLWLDLALLTKGAERERAFARAHALNPLETEINGLIGHK